MTTPPASDVCLVRVDDEPGSGAWNMAVDEAMLEDAIANGTCRLRIYRWSEPTLSLGYFQSPDERLADPALSKLPFVRRLSGGGAILHDNELTYSCVVPSGHPLGRNPLEIYDAVHSAIVATIRSRGVAIAFRSDVEPAAGRDRGAEPFLCFGRGDPRDLVFAGHKILGSAQRRRRGAILQHGSLLLRRSPHAPAHPGLSDLAPDFSTADLGVELATQIAPKLALGMEFSPVEQIDVSAGRILNIRADRPTPASAPIPAAGTSSRRTPDPEAREAR